MRSQHCAKVQTGGCEETASLKRHLLQYAELGIRAARATSYNSSPINRAPMKPFLVSLIVVEVSLGASLLFEGLRSRDSSMEDTLEVSKDAEAAGELYKQEAAKMPTEQESAKSILLANAETIGSIDEDGDSEFAFWQ